VIFIAWGVLSTSYVHVADGYFAQLFRVYGGDSLPAGRIVALAGEKGPQAEVLTPGFHFSFLINVLYHVDANKKEFEVPNGQVGVLVAKDGVPLRPGQTFADPFRNSQPGWKTGYFRPPDARRGCLPSGGQRGPQLTVTAPYRINTYLWDVKIPPAKEFPGFRRCREVECLVRR
jgi:hypothetical protein